MVVKDESVAFYCQGQRLYGNLAVPSPGAPCILMSHGFEASKDGTKWSYLAPRLNQRGYATFRFTYRGCGREPEESDGLFEDTTLTGRIQDYRAALDYLEGVPVDKGRMGVIGSSFGGEVIIAARDPRAQALVCVATPSHPSTPTEEQLQAVRRSGFFQTPSGKRLGMSYFEDARRYDLCQAIEEIDRPVLVVHGSLDDDVPLDDAYELYERAREPKRLEVIDGGDHSLRRPEDMRRILQLCLEWFGQYL